MDSGKIMNQSSRPSTLIRHSRRELRAGPGRLHWRHVILALVCGCHLLACTQQSPKIAEGMSLLSCLVNYRPKGSERYFREYMERVSQEQLQSQTQDAAAGGDGSTCEPIGLRVDRMAERLADAVEDDERLVESMRVALKIDEIETGRPKCAGKPPEVPQEVSLLPPPSSPPSSHNRGRRSLLHAIEPHSSTEPIQLGRRRRPGTPTKDARILHQSRSIDMDKFRELIQDQFTRLPDYDQRQWLEASRRLLLHRNSGPRMGPSSGGGGGSDDNDESDDMSLQNILTLGAQTGTQMLDHFYSTPEFMWNLPFIGKRIIELRRKSESVYHLLQMLRHAHSFYKLKGAETWAREHQHDTSGIQAELDTTIKLISSDGAKAFQKITEHLFHKSNAEAGGSEEKESGIRLLYAIMSYVMGDNC